MLNLTSPEGEIVSSIINKEQQTGQTWITLTRENALEAVSLATKVLDAPTIGYVRTTTEGEIEWTHIYQVSKSSCPSSHVQFHTRPEVATHWVAVAIPVEGEHAPTYINIYEGQRYNIDPNNRFLVVERKNWYSSIEGPARGENPRTKYEFYIPFQK